MRPRVYPTRVSLARKQLWCRPQYEMDHQDSQSQLFAMGRAWRTIRAGTRRESRNVTLH